MEIREKLERGAGLKSEQIENVIRIFQEQFRLSELDMNIGDISITCKGDCQPKDISITCHEKTMKRVKRCQIMIYAEENPRLILETE